MYARPTPEGRLPPRNLHLPQNYSGNAFRREEKQTPEAMKERNLAQTAEELPLVEVENVENKEPSPSVSEPSPSSQDAAVNAGKFLSPPGFRLDLGRFFGRDRGFGIGFEELMILGLILLVSQSDAKEDLILLLFLLLFIQ